MSDKKDESRPPVRLKPVIYTTSSFKWGAPERTQQLFLLKALQVTQDPQKLKQMIGVKTVAEVYRTLDKMAMRKEYHEALARKGISFDFIVGGIKKIAEEGYKDSDKLKAFEVLLKSVGMEKYDSDGGTGGDSWEDALLKVIAEKKENPQLGPAIGGDAIPEYEVKQPEIPESAKKMREEEAEIFDSIYDGK